MYYGGVGYNNATTSFVNFGHYTKVEEITGVILKHPLAYIIHIVNALFRISGVSVESY